MCSDHIREVQTQGFRVAVINSTERIPVLRPAVYSFSLSMVRLLLFQKFCPALRVSCRSVENLRVLFEHIQKHFPHGRRHKGRKFTAHTPPPFCLYFWQRVLFSFLPPLEPPCVSPPVQRTLPQRLSAGSLQLLFRLPSWPSFQPSSP